MTIGRTPFTFAAAAVLFIATLPAIAAAQQAKVTPVERGQTPGWGIQGFSVVLVLGGTGAQIDEFEAKLAELRAQGYNDRHPRVLELQHEIAEARADLSAGKVRLAGSASENVPAAARKALADMKDFLPYKRYQLLDAAWTLCCGTAGNSRLSGRLRGPDGRDYLYTIDPGGVSDSKISLRFTMREVQEVPFSPVNGKKMSDTARLELMKQQAEANRELDEAVIQLRAVKQRYDVGTATDSDWESATSRERRAQQRLQELQQMVEVSAGQARGGAAQASAGAGGAGGARATAPVPRETMDSSFSISPGETVVIGTSRLNGDQALIAILTAATKPAAGR